MLKEYLSRRDTPHWENVLPGVRTCRFALRTSDPQALRPIPVCGEPLQFEVLFCQSGHLHLAPRQGAPILLDAPGVLLLACADGLRDARCSGDLGGLLVTVDARSAKDSLRAVCAALGLRLDIARVRRTMAEAQGFLTLPDTPWALSFFETVQRLPDEAQARYGVFKAVELLYLLCTTQPAIAPAAPLPDGCAAPLMREIGAYLCAHLSEKHTIPLLCRRFSVSPTYLKEHFRRAFGAPIHSWLVEQRLERARALLTESELPVQQVAHAVGYEGMSQFNAAFKRQCGMTPGQYRKMSKTVSPRPF
ncbi:MAG: AraC family transcriptional regulator [Eubacteriales bacterium]|nr:AraC family transcriptional regulator [Eubacteriales bacterium]